jgi:RNA polymerase sigma factor (sigma-70 family)
MLPITDSATIADSATITDSATIVDRAAAGDQQAWNRLVDQHGGMLRAIAAGFRLSRADAEDAMQTTWLSLIQHIGRLRSPDRVNGWLATTMRRNCMRLMQRQRWEVLGDVSEVAAIDQTSDVEGMMVRNEADTLLWRLVGRLPPRQARLVRALFADDASYRDITKALAMPMGAIGPSRARALRRLEQLLRQAGGAPDALRRSA